MNILNFWFPDDNFQQFWFDKSVDNVIKENFFDKLKYYENTEINYQMLNDKELLEVIIILDQFSRNIYRSENFRKNDDKALEIANYFFENREWKDKSIQHLVFYLMPFRHSNEEENLQFVYDLLNQVDTNKLNEGQKKLFTKFYKKTLQILKGNYREKVRNAQKAINRRSYIRY